MGISEMNIGVNDDWNNYLGHKEMSSVKSL
ncbi:hypothetical protein SAMN05421578_10692 [Paenibacillus macquariensis]|uniref:Uncharacterized protein n=1 Tax=Paenibacillus macquariensis TaxID=948756 RepID=A0ABY1JZB1_9BACL|nr:hypothetical protein SAMN05421578_10692 [Paenibacillus macquariensis]